MTTDPAADEPRVSAVLPRGVRTYKPRRTRATLRARLALERGSTHLLDLADRAVDLASVFGRDIPVVLEIGCGDGSATAALAAAQPDLGVIAVDVHTPGIGALLADLHDMGLENVRVVEGDALLVLERMIPSGSLTGVRTFFPDPWPKARHHKRRLVRPAVARLVHDRLVPGGWWHLATDWPDYVEVVVETMRTTGGWAGGPVGRPPERPVTRYERRARAADRTVTDLIYRSVAE